MAYVDHHAIETWQELRHAWTDEDGEYGYVALSPDAPTEADAVRLVREFILETVPDEAADLEAADCATLGWAVPTPRTDDPGFTFTSSDDPRRRFRMWRVDVSGVW